MNVIILCEGESDRVVLDRYFCKRFGFLHKGDGEIRNEYIEDCYYEKDQILLTIRVVQGCTKFCTKLEEVLRVNYVNTNLQNRYTHIAVIADHDSEAEKNALLQELNQILQKYNLPNFQDGAWCKGRQPTAMGGRLIDVETLFLGIPLEGEGALETALLSGMEKTAKGACLARVSRKFVQCLVKHKEKENMPYLSVREDQVKAPLAVYLAIAAPTHIYQKHRKILSTIDWNELAEIQRTLQAFDLFDGAERPSDEI